MALDLMRERGVPLERQLFSWRDLVATPHSRLDDDAFSRVRILLAAAVEAGQVRFLRYAAQLAGGPGSGPTEAHALREPLARIRRVEHFQQTVAAWLVPPDLSSIELACALEQTAIEVGACVGELEPNHYLAQAHRFAMLEDLDHLYRLSALLDRVAGGDANTVTQSATDIRPGRPTAVQHRHPVDDLRDAMDGRTAAPISRLGARVQLAVAEYARDAYALLGPRQADPGARLLFAELAAVEEQHATQHASLLDPGEELLERWLLQEAAEVWVYWSCVNGEPNLRLRGIWERMLAYELGQLHVVMDLYRRHSQRDPADVVPSTLPAPITFVSHRQYIRDALAREAELRAVGPQFVPRTQEPIGGPSATYRAHLNNGGAPSEAVAAGWRWAPGGELARMADAHVGTPVPAK